VHILLWNETEVDRCHGAENVKSEAWGKKENAALESVEGGDRGLVLPNDQLHHGGGIVLGRNLPIRNTDGGGAPAPRA